MKIYKVRVYRNDKLHNGTYLVEADSFGDAETKALTALRAHATTIFKKRETEIEKFMNDTPVNSIKLVGETLK